MKRDYMADYKENIYFENSKYWYSLFSLKSKSILIRKEYYSFEQITDCIVKLKSNKEDSLTTLYHILFKRSITCKDAQVKDNLIIVTHDKHGKKTTFLIFPYTEKRAIYTIRTNCILLRQNVFYKITLPTLTLS